MSKVDAAKLMIDMSVTPPTDLPQNRRSFVRQKIHALSHPLRRGFGDVNVSSSANKAAQIQLSMQYKAMIALGLPMPKFEDVEFRAYSQFGEDGILLYILSVIGTTNKRCVEMCGGGGIDNTANLIINHGWNGLFFDGNERKIRKGQQFYNRCLDTVAWPPKMVHTWVSAENVNELLERHGYIGEVDLLSLDMDGIDYWVWKAIESINPRVVVLEFNNALGPDLSVTIPYKPGFIWESNMISWPRYRVRKMVNTFLGKKTADWFDNYYGASLAAFVNLGKQKGYRLVGCERYGINAFFIRAGISEEILPEISPSACFNHPFTQYASEVRRQTIANKEWIEV